MVCSIFSKKNRSYSFLWCTQRVILAVFLLMTVVAVCSVRVALSDTVTDVKNSVAVRVNGEAISEREVLAAIISLNGGNTGDSKEGGKNQKQPLSSETDSDLRDQAIQMIVDRRLIEQFVKKQSSNVDKKEVDEVIDRVKKSVQSTGESFDDYLKEQGQTESDLRLRVTGMLRWKKYVTQEATDEALKEYFQKNVKHFDGTQVRISQVLFKTPDEEDKEAFTAQVKILQELRQSILKKEVTFSEAARIHSHSPSSKRGGDLGFIPRRNRMFEAFSRAAFDLSPDEISEPLLTPQGLHLITITAIRSGEKSFEDVKRTVFNEFARELELKVSRQERESAEVEIIAPPTQQESEMP